LRLDELPQLWNVFTGEMSFVGPRPLLPIDQPNDGQLRLKVPPGVTGWAQINGGRQITADNKGSLDDWYVRHASFWLDVRIIARTVGIVVLGDDRYLPRSSGPVEVAKQMAEIGDPSSLRWASAKNAQEGAAG
jgi:lipopolysaccharide/colanic/teichoic acid biosynthesis glycosyltransferase